jgi:hypothetical protein
VLCARLHACAALVYRKQTLMSVRFRFERNPRLSNFTSYSTNCQRMSKFALRRG